MTQHSSDLPSGRLWILIKKLKSLWAKVAQALLRALFITSSILSCWLKKVNKTAFFRSRSEKRAEKEEVNENYALAQGDTKNIMSRWELIYFRKKVSTLWQSHDLSLYKSQDSGLGFHFPKRKREKSARSADWLNNQFWLFWLSACPLFYRAEQTLKSVTVVQ